MLKKICEVTNKTHVADWGTVKCITERDKKKYVVVNCKDCGQTGTLAQEFLMQKLTQWDRTIKLDETI